MTSNCWITVVQIFVNYWSHLLTSGVTVIYVVISYENERLTKNKSREYIKSNHRKIQSVNFLILLFGLLRYADGVDIPWNTFQHQPREEHCGVDKSTTNVVYEGFAKIQTYPWLGVLFYTSGDKKYSTSVVLVTRQIVIGSAVDIDKVPKIDFRAHSRVFLGRNCSGKGIRIKDYTYHPDFNRATYSALALVQLETIYWMTDLHPICTPPSAAQIKKPQFYVMAQTDDCESSTVKIHKMAYIDLEQCKIYYRKSELDLEMIWPTHTICAKALTGPECVWSSGAVLAMRQNNKWHLIGFGVYGPGCHAPSRFFDYTRYRPWLRSTVERIGRPTVTRMAENYLILRRSLSNVQRYGPCDPEEIRSELFTDRTIVERGPSHSKQLVRYNFTIFANLEYSCVVFRSFHYKRSKWIKDKPLIHLKRWCLTPKEICYSFHYLQIDFAVEIHFREAIMYQVMAYGQEIKMIDGKKLMAHLNSKKKYPEIVTGSNFYNTDEGNDNKKEDRSN